jgi:hypothetical protein
MLFKEMIAINMENYKGPINKNAQLVTGKTGGFV